MKANIPPLDVTAGGRMADAVFSHLRRAIVRHELPPNFHLSVPALAARFGISRSPVHEAVKRLVQEGLATEYPRRGAFVTSVNAPALLPLYELRCVLEGFAAGLAAERAGPAAIAQMREVLDRHAKAIEEDDLERHIEIDIEFHRLIVTAAANPALEETLSGLYERIRSAMMVRVVPTGPRQALEDHKDVFAAIEKRDAIAADRCAREHVMRVYARLATRRFTQSSPFEDRNGGPSSSEVAAQQQTL